VRDGLFCDAAGDNDGGGVVDLGGKTAIPGLIDTHIHGCGGYDFTSGDIDGLKKIAGFLAKNGVTSFIPTSVSAPLCMLKAAYKNAAELYGQHDYGAKIVGINAEGPFLSDEKRGAHPPEYLIAPSLAVFSDLNNAADGLIKIVCVAPETDGAIDFIKSAVKSCRISAGHTACDYDTAKRAFVAGATKVTHLYNAMPPFLHMEPGIIGAATESKNVYAELICDGVHVHESAVRAAFKLFPHRVVLISDSLSVCGVNGVECLSGTSVVTVNDERAVLLGGRLAGSNSTLFDCVKNAVSMGIPPKDAIEAATKIPALSVRIFDRTGSISVGKAADFIVYASGFSLEAVYIDGKRVS